MTRIHAWFATLALTASFFAVTPPAIAQDTSPIVTARLFVDSAHVINDGDAVSPTATPNGNFIWAAVAFTIPEHWHIYWQNPGDSGIPTSITWESLPKGVTAGPIHWPVPVRAEMGGLVNYGYENTVILPVPLQLSEDAATSGTITAKVDWLVCKETCIPESAVLTADIGDKASEEDVAALDKALDSVPMAMDIATYVVADDSQVRIAFNEQANSHADIFPITDGWFPNNATPEIHRAKGWIGFVLPRGSAPVSDTLEAVITVKHEGITTHWQQTAKRVEQFPEYVPQDLFDTVPTTAAPDNDITLLTALLFALIGGLILNLMPCVLPVLSLKVLALSRKADASRAEAFKHGLAYTGGVLASFALIGAALLIIKAGGAAIGWGFQLQSPGFVLGLIFVVFLVALNLLSVFELPVLFGSRGQSLTSRDSVVGSAATGVLAVALATPCTAPFMAPALGAALTLPSYGAMLIFLALGLGLALPYLLISISPAARRLLPKPGLWMQHFKEVLAFPMLATAAWLLWVLTEQTGSMGLLLALGYLIAIALALWGLKRHQSRLWRAVWKVVLVGSIACALINAPVQDTGSKSTMSMDHVAFDARELEALRAAGKPVFVDATAAWCLTCKVNERVALSDSRIVSLFKERNITFMVADWTNRDAAITAWLASFGRNGVPLYVYYPPSGEPVVLPQILTPALVEDAIRAGL